MVTAFAKFSLIKLQLELSEITLLRIKHKVAAGCKLSKAIVGDLEHVRGLHVILLTAAANPISTSRSIKAVVELGVLLEGLRTII